MLERWLRSLQFNSATTTFKKEAKTFFNVPTNFQEIEKRLQCSEWLLKDFELFTSES